MKNFTHNLLDCKIKITEPALKDQLATIVGVGIQKENDLHFYASLHTTGEIKTLLQNSFVLTNI